MNDRTGVGELLSRTDSSPFLHRGGEGTAVHVMQCLGQLDTGYTGELCETDIDECETATCLNGATCIDQVNNYTCDCTPPFTGPMCEVEFLPCDSAPCQNEGLCVNIEEEETGYQCNCQLGFSGEDCSEGKFNVVLHLIFLCNLFLCRH